jgi:hypothetical protein
VSCKVLVLRASTDDKAERAHGERQMLWWLIGAWVASGLLIPILWLLSRGPLSPGSKWTSWNRGHTGRLLLCGLVGIGAMTLLFIGSFGNPIPAMGSLYSAFAGAQNPVPQAAVTPSPAEIELVAVQRQGDAIQGQLAKNQQELAQAIQELAQQTIDLEAAQTETDNLRQRIDELGQQRQAEEVWPTLDWQRPDDARHQHWQHGQRKPMSAYVAQSHRGTWLFPPNPNSGGSN